MPSALSPAPAPVVTAIDPHKASWTAVAVDNRLQPLAVIRVEVNRDGYRQLRRFAGRWSHAGRVSHRRRGSRVGRGRVRVGR